MSIKKHKDYSHEIKRLDETKEYLENIIATVINNRVKFKEEIKEAYIQLDYLDSSLSYSSIMLNSKLLEGLEKNFELLINSRKKPYFARIDIKQNDKDFDEKLYIGKVSLFDETMETPLVVDWRAPIASVYYDSRLGKTTYKAGKKDHTIELLSKRQYIIEDGKLINYMDVDISTTDTFLQASLEGHAGEKLKDIVSTIQAEQNEIIRADIDKPLIVQGVAGSGKTTIALHRIAYLIYTYAETFSTEQFMIVAPNTLFLDYISAVLPELGANKVSQTTFIDLMYQLIGKKLKITDGNKKLNELIRTDVDSFSNNDKLLIKSAALLKNSMRMKEMIDKYLLDLETRFIPNEDYYLDDILLVDLDNVKEMFFSTYNYQPYFKRVEMIKKNLLHITRNRSKEILKTIKEEFDKKMDHIRYNEPFTEDRRLKIISIINERDSRLDQITKASKTSVKKYINKFLSNDLLSFYYEFQENIKIYTQNNNIDVLEYIKKQSEKSDKKIYELEDLASLVYMKHRIFGLGESLDIKMVIIDEAQDLSDFQFYVLREALDTEKFTIFGDLSQGIHMYRSIKNWDYLKTSIFKTEANYLTLEQSYRTTIEIMNEANFVLTQLQIPDIIIAKPVVRHGEIPSKLFMNTNQEVLNTIIDKIKQWQNENLTTIAIITKSSQEAEVIYKEIKKLNNKLSITLVDEKSKHFDHNILVLPVYLAKGLEFDATIVVALNEKYEINPLDIKLMYVAMTRAMHRLSIIGKKSSIAYY